MMRDSISIESEKGMLRELMRNGRKTKKEVGKCLPSKKRKMAEKCRVVQYVE